MVEAGNAPDGGWGWLIVFGSLLAQAVTIGITYTFGVLYVDLVEYFGNGISATAWIGSIQPALLYLTGVITGPLLKRYGCRAVILAGTLISSAGFGLSYFATNIFILFVTYGGLTGIGFGLMFVTSLVIVQHYFESRRAMATGIATSGSGIGTLVFGFLTEILLDRLQWRVTLLINGAITLITGVLCAVLYRPLPKATQEEKEPILTKTNDNEYNTFCPDSTPDTETSPSGSPSGTDNSPSSADNSPSALPTHSVLRQQDIRSTPPLPNIEEDPYNTETQPQHCCRCCFTCIHKLHLDLCRDPRLIIFCVTIILFCFGYHVPYAFLPSRAITAYNIKPNLAAFLVSIMGISNVLFRLFFGWIGDKSEQVRFVLMGAVLFLCGLNSVLSFLYTTYPLLVVYSALFGAFSGCFASLYPVVMVDLMGLEVIEYTLGLGMASSSIAFLLASPVSGWVIQLTGGYNAAFLMVGVEQIVGGAVFFSLCMLPLRVPPSLTDTLTRSEDLVARHASTASSRRSSYMSESIIV